MVSKTRHPHHVDLLPHTSSPPCFHPTTSPPHRPTTSQPHQRTNPNPKKVGIVERMAEFNRLAMPGMQVLFAPLCFPVEIIKQRMDSRALQLNVVSDSKSRDNVFVKVQVAVQFTLVREHADDAFYKMDDRDGQLRSYVNDAMRNICSGMDLDDMFISKVKMSGRCRDNVANKMAPYGYRVGHTLITDFEIDQRVKEETQNVFVQRMNKLADYEVGEALKICTIKISEGQAEQRRYLGQGTARQRGAIVTGMQETIRDFVNSVNDVNPDEFEVSADEAVRVQMMMQYFDGQIEMSKQPGFKHDVMYMSCDPRTVDSMRSQIGIGRVKRASEAVGGGARGGGGSEVLVPDAAKAHPTHSPCQQAAPATGGAAEADLLGLESSGAVAAVPTDAAADVAASRPGFEATDTAAVLPVEGPPGTAPAVESPTGDSAEGPGGFARSHTGALNGPGWQPPGLT